MEPKHWGSSSWIVLENLVYNNKVLIDNIKTNQDDDTDDYYKILTFQKLEKIDLRTSAGIKMLTYNFILSHCATLPCEQCRKDSKEYIKENKFPIHNHHKWMRWLFAAGVEWT